MAAMASCMASLQPLSMLLIAHTAHRSAMLGHPAISQNTANTVPATSRRKAFSTCL
jgi:hypothetical protein